jgi:HAD superfamily hydrolase (TIGR01509 family)
MQKTLFFDLGNVLLFFSHLRMCEQIGQLLALPSCVVHKELTEKGFRDQYERGQITSEMYHQSLCAVAQKHISFEDLLEATSNIFSPNWAMLPLLTELKRKGHLLLLLSNTCEAHFSFAQRHYADLLRPFDGFILSYEVGAIKPEEAIFKAALKKTPAPPSNCFYIDDIPEFIEAAARVDIPGVVFTGIDPLIDELKEREFL